MKIKLCGLRTPRDVGFANEAAPDYVGFVFAGSRRRVSPVAAARLRERLAEPIVPVGVFVDEPVDAVAALIADGVIEAAQLHGSEDAAYVAALRARTDVPLIKAARVRSRADVAAAAALDVDGLLLDAYSPDAAGGTGAGFDWSLIGPVAKPFFLAGGLTPDTIAAAAATGCAGVDLSSGIETDGVKDKDKMIRAVRAARAATAQGANA